MLTRVVIVLAAIGIMTAIYLGIRSDGPTIDPDDPAQVAVGRQVYLAACASCHGDRLQGQPNWDIRGADGLLPAPPHDRTGHTWHHPAEQLYTITAEGPAALAGAGYRSAMPGFRGMLDDAEIAAVVAYIISTWPPDIRERRATIEARSAPSP